MLIDVSSWGLAQKERASPGQGISTEATGCNNRVWSSGAVQGQFLVKHRLLLGRMFNPHSGWRIVLVSEFDSQPAFVHGNILWHSVKPEYISCPSLPSVGRSGLSRLSLFFPSSFLMTEQALFGSQIESVCAISLKTTATNTTDRAYGSDNVPAAT